MRRNIFVILEEEMNLEYEIETIVNLFNEARIYGFNINYSIEDYFDQECIHLWKNRKYVTSSKQMRERLGITNEDIKEGLDDKKVLVLLEYILNVMAVCNAYMPEDSEWSKEFEMLYQNVVNVVNMMNMLPRNFRNMMKDRKSTMPCEGTSKWQNSITVLIEPYLSRDAAFSCKKLNAERKFYK